MTLEEAIVFRDRYKPIVIGQRLDNYAQKYIGESYITDIIIATNESVQAIFLSMYYNDIDNDKALALQGNLSNDLDVFVISFDESSTLVKRSLKVYLDKTNQWLERPNQ